MKYIKQIVVNVLHLYFNWKSILEVYFSKLWNLQKGSHIENKVYFKYTFKTFTVADNLACKSAILKSLHRSFKTDTLKALKLIHVQKLFQKTF